MSAWTTVPCLLALRDEFNRLSPRRDKGADGTIGDSSHTSSSDHTPDEDSDVLRDHDADSKNEVHALDIDSTGPWPESFDTIIKRLVARERAEYNSPTVFGRLQNVIWNRQIASRSWGWTWRPYTGSDPHTNHAHFSARYTTAQENDTRPWGVYLEDDMTPEELLGYDPGDPAKGVPNPFNDQDTNKTISVRTALYNALILPMQVRDQVAALNRSLTAAIQALAAKDTVDEGALAAELGAVVAAQVIAALPQGADQISQDEVTTAVKTALRDAFTAS